ncbi:hypothetical protein [Stutzerimonas chloritidismutans]|uniref:hypothetical protein n=1 Tax=Stutzerimonas chloritidismutans TaxID=203192 RepID=UPI003F14E0FF
MIRIRGRIGDWPVDLAVELDEGDWDELARRLPASASQPAEPVRAEPDPLWAGAQRVLREAGKMDGPQLLAELQALAGSPQAGKRLLVRLRHAAQVKVHNSGDAPLYQWLEPETPAD